MMLEYGSLLQRSLREPGNAKQIIARICPLDMPQLMREVVDESVIQRFEVCYDVPVGSHVETPYLIRNRGFSRM